MTIKPNFQGEVQLAGWSESHNGGCKVTFWLADSADLDAFRAMTVRKGNTAGQRLACVLVEIGDDEQPVQVDEPAPARERAKTGPLCQEAVRYCEMPEFCEWLTKNNLPTNNANEAKARVLEVCGIDSRKELDFDAAAGKAFISVFRLPFMRWMKSRKGREQREAATA